MSGTLGDTCRHDQWRLITVHLAEVVRRPLIATLASSGLIQGLSIITGVVLARALGPDQRGELGTIILWPGIVATLAILGLPEAVSVFIAARTITINEALRTALPIVAGLAGAGLIAVAGIVLLLSPGMTTDAKVAATLYVVFVPINMITLTLLGALNGTQNFGALNTVRISVVVVAAVALPLLALSGYLTVGTAVGTYIAANLTALAIAAVAVRGVASESIAGRASGSGAHVLLGYGIRSQAGVAAGLIGERLDQLAISAFLAPKQFGLYLAAIAVSAGTAIVSTSITTVLVPTVAAEPQERRLEAARHYFKLTALLTSAIAILTAVTAPILVPLVFGSAFQEAVVPAQVLLVGTVPLALSRALAAATRASGRPWGASRAEWLSLICAIPAYVLLLPSWGLIGAASASVVAYSASLLFQAFSAKSALGARSVRDLLRHGSWEATIEREAASV